MFKAYLLKFAGILVVGSAAGITHWAVEPPLKLHLDEIADDAGTVVIPSKPKQDTPESASNQDEQTQPEDVAEPGAGSSIVLKREITLDQAKTLFENNLADFVDARPPDKYEDGHIDGAYSVPPDAFYNGTPAVIDFFDVERPIVVYCTGGDCHDSHVVVEQIMLIRPELVRVHVFTDGYPAWTGAGLATDIGPDPLAE
ncbi:MAG: rhodanese-like domain-containing protein [Phycisphaerales bacterium]|nr:rhodanese-like domain-containing protein [Phycisphaerales bacterium]MCB9835561.1 rhodanese-like domain-containing protein [Phycisphaera sp.]